MNALSKEQAAELVELRKQQGFEAGSDRVLNGGIGCFYLVQLIPELDPRRVKLGFTTSIEERLAAHRTVAPTAILLRSWPCHPGWEPAAIAAATATKCQRLGPEVFIAENVIGMRDRLDTFFSLMPRLTVDS